MSHHEESTIVVVFGVDDVVCELSACRNRLASSFSALLFAMDDLSAIVAGRWHGLPTLFNVEAPPSSEGSLMNTGSFETGNMSHFRNCPLEKGIQ